MASMVGIKIANGEFYSIIEENSQARKRLILTTVHDNQESMQIDLYRSELQSMSVSQYIGSIVVEHIQPRPRGEPSIELIISSETDGTLSADATDLDSSSRAEHHHLKASLRALAVEEEQTFPDFEMEPVEPPPQSLYDKAVKVRQTTEEKKKTPWLLIILIGFALVLVLFALWFFVFRDRGEKD